MNRRSFILHGAALCAAASVVPAYGARLPLSELVVVILSAEQQSFNRETYARGGSMEITRFIAQAKIQEVLNSDHGLSPGMVIEISYIIRLVQPSGRQNGPSLKAGDTVTLSVFGSGRAFEWNPTWNAPRR